MDIFDLLNLLSCPKVWAEPWLVSEFLHNHNRYVYFSFLTFLYKWFRCTSMIQKQNSPLNYKYRNIHKTRVIRRKILQCFFCGKMSLFLWPDLDHAPCSSEPRMSPTLLTYFCYWFCAIMTEIMARAAQHKVSKSMLLKADFWIFDPTLAWPV